MKLSIWFEQVTSTHKDFICMKYISECARASKNVANATNEKTKIINHENGSTFSQFVAGELRT